MLDGIIIPIMAMLYSILYFVAETLWGINQAILLVGYYVLSITAWLSHQMFQPLLASIGNSIDGLLLPVFTLAMITLSITYMLGVFGVFKVVEFKSAVVWLLVAVMWFQFGPELYLGFEQFRRDLSGAFYGSVFTDVTGSGNTIAGMDMIGDAGDMQINPPTNNFGAFLPYDTAIDGLDVALAYLNADGCDVLRSAGCLFQPMPEGGDGRLPLRWYVGGYFDINQHSYFYEFDMTQDERQQSLDDAARGIWIALSGIVVSLFGLLEQIVQLLLTIAFGIAFASFFIAILFAFFKRTESITWSVFDIILGLFVQSIITALLLALIMAFVSLAGATGNGILLLGVGFIGIILVAILLLGAVKAILGAINGLMGAFGQATGGHLNAGGSVTQVAGAYMTGGATLLGGGFVAQAVGGALGPGIGQQAYYAARTFGDGTFIGRAANDVAQGATAAYLGPVGGYMLGQGASHQMQTPTDVVSGMLGSAQNRVARLTLGTPIRADVMDEPDDAPPANPTAAGSEQRVDPLTRQPYSFETLANGQGRRRYDDGSQLYTSWDDEPLQRERARAENQAHRAATVVSGLDTTAMSQIDAVDDDEHEQLLTAMHAQNPHEISPVIPRLLMPDDDAPNADVSEVSGAGGSVEVFLRDMESVYPGSTGRADLLGADGQSDTPTIAAPQRQPDPDAGDDDVIHVPQVGPATQARLADVGITTAGQLAESDRADLAGAGIGSQRADFLISQAQAYVANPLAQPTPVMNDTPKMPNAAQLAAANDAANNDDGVRLANNMGVAIRQAQVVGGTPTSGQAAEIALQSGLPAVPQAGQLIQVASAMGLSPQQVHHVMQDVQGNQSIGQEVQQSIRTSLSQVTLANGQTLDGGGIDRALSLLEGAAQALVTAANSMNQSRQTADGDAATIGAPGIAPTGSA